MKLNWELNTAIPAWYAETVLGVYWIFIESRQHVRLELRVEGVSPRTLGRFEDQDQAKAAAQQNADSTLVAETARFGSYTLSDALDGLFATDTGAASSGIRDDALRDEVYRYVRALPDTDRKLVLSRIGRSYASDRRLAQGYTIEDVVDFFNWVVDQDLWG